MSAVEVTATASNNESSRVSPRRTSRKIEPPIVVASTKNDVERGGRQALLSGNSLPCESERSNESAKGHTSVLKRNRLKRKIPENEHTNAKKIAITKRKRFTKRIRTSDDETVPNEDSNKDEDDADNEGLQQKQARKSAARKVENSDGSWYCPHCNKKFGSSLGLQYHVDQFVCQPTLRPGGPIIRKGRRKILRPVDEDDVPATKTYKKIRGKINDRTCPNCERIFTSVAGMQYHRTKLVCKQAKSSDASIPFDTLTPGLCFVTPYGIAEVISDDRAVPCVASESSNQQVLPADTNMKKLTKLYHGALAKRATRDQKQLNNVAIMSLARRMLLRRAYDENRNHLQINESATNCATTIRNIYSSYGEVPLPSYSAPKRKELEDPSAPIGSFPDRIVECMLLPDQRARYLGHYTNDDTTACLNFTLLEGLANTHTNSNLIFIRRRLLTTQHSLDTERYYCSACYQCFTSKSGYKYHVESESCVKKARTRAGANEKQLAAIESRALQIVDQYKDVTKPPSDTDMTHQYQATIDIEDGKENTISADLNTEPNIDSTTVDAASLVPPDVVLAQLESELYRALGQTIGPMYPEVWRALQYRKPSNKMKILKKSSNNIIHSPTANKKKRSKPSTDSVVISSPKAAPHTSAAKQIVPDLLIVDIRPLAQEIDAGRYPSMKRYVFEGTDDRDTKCSICKQVEIPYPEKYMGESSDVEKEKALPCDFCRQVEHYTCAITKFSIKYPEPCDDFMCHNCIGIISTRRTRAERRRLEKLHPVNSDSATVESFALQHHSVNAAKQREVALLTNGIVRDREFDCVAAQGRRLDELYILLRDAKARLALSLDVEEMNESRQLLLQSMCDE